MSKRHAILLLPFTVLAIAALAIYAFFSGAETYISFYIAVISGVAAFTAYQSVFIVRSMVWWEDVEDLSKEEIADLAMSIVVDFSRFFVIHSVIVTLVYFVGLWIYELF